MFEKNIKQKPFAGFGGFGGGGLGLGGGASLGPFVASGGTKTGPTGGYYYHEYTPATPSPQKVFTVTDGIADIEVLAQGAGSPGGSGSGANGGGGGGGDRGTEGSGAGPKGGGRGGIVVIRYPDAV